MKDWTSERPTEEGFYWFLGWVSMYWRDEKPYLYIAKFHHYPDKGLLSFIDGSIRHEFETLGIWQRLEVPDISPLTVTVEDFRNAEFFSQAEVLRGS